MLSLYSFTILFLTVVFLVQGTTAQYQAGYSFKSGYCNICRDVPGQLFDDRSSVRVLGNPSESFQMNGKSWTCEYLQATVQDVNPYSGAAGEARWCGLAQTFAEESCTCNGPSIKPMSSNVKDLNPACDLCAGMQFDYVPTVNAGLTADTGVAGNMNCKGLYNAMSQGVLTSNLCGDVTRNAGPVCCNLESIEIGGGSGSISSQQQQTPAQPTCKTATQQCATNGDCCAGLTCKLKQFGRPKSCASAASRPRTSIAGKGIGGAASRSRTYSF